MIIDANLQRIVNRHLGRRGLLCAILFATVVFAASAAHAQFRASIQGTVTDPTGAVIPGATLTFTDTDTNHALTATSNGSGVYNFNALAARPLHPHRRAPRASRPTRHPGCAHHSRATQRPQRAHGIGDTNTTVTVIGRSALPRSKPKPPPPAAPSTATRSSTSPPPAATSSSSPNSLPASSATALRAQAEAPTICPAHTGPGGSGSRRRHLPDRKRPAGHRQRRPVRHQQHQHRRHQHRQRRLGRNLRHHPQRRLRR